MKKLSEFKLQLLENYSSSTRVYLKAPNIRIFFNIRNDCNLHGFFWNYTVVIPCVRTGSADNINKQDANKYERVARAMVLAAAENVNYTQET